MCIQRLASICEGKRIGMRNSISLGDSLVSSQVPPEVRVGYRLQGQGNKPANRTMKNNWWRVRRVVTQFAVYMQGIA